MINLSVIIPVYNVEKYLQNCIDSLLSQTAEGMEFIFVNDASPDGCMEILEKNWKRDTRIQVINLEQNIRQGGARNAGIRCAKGKYIGFVDSDDFVASDMYETLLLSAQSNDADAAFIDYLRVPENATISDLEFEHEMSDFLPKEIIALSGKELTKNDKTQILTSSLVHVWAGIYKTEMLRKNDLYFPEKIRYEDNYWCTLITCYFNKINIIPRKKYYYRDNPTSTVNSSLTAHLHDRVVVEQMLYDELIKRALHDTYHDAFEAICIERATLTTYHQATFKSNKINVRDMVDVVNRMKRKYPKWNKNSYYRKMMDNSAIKSKMLKFMVLHFPRFTTLCLALYKILFGPHNTV